MKRINTPEKKKTKLGRPRYGSRPPSLHVFTSEERMKRFPRRVRYSGPVFPDTGEFRSAAFIDLLTREGVLK